MTRPVAIRTIVRHDRHDMDGAHPDQDLVAVEAPVSLLLQGPDGLVRDLGLLMRTPGHDEDLALGALVSEGVIRHSNDVRRVAVGDTAITVEVTASADVSAISARVTTATSACGLCGRLAVQHLDAWPHLARPADTPRISAAIIGTLSDRMRETQRALAQTGGLHAAGLFTTDGTLVEVREDVGRHNAVDKIAGTLVRRDALPASDLVLTLRDYGGDEANTVSETTLQLYVGGGSDRLRKATGIHWHTSASSTIEYIATDAKREVIPWVRVTYRDGTVHEFVAEDTPAGDLARGERRQMDCVDCHNRTGHPFASTPESAVNKAFAAGEMPADLPYARRESVAALAAPYDSKAAALDAIAVRLRGFYRTEVPQAYISRRQDVERVVTATQELYRRNVFPTMKVGFGTYSNNIGHVDFPGCFRCHDDNHKTTDGRVIRQTCNLCHQIR